MLSRRQQFGSYSYCKNLNFFLHISCKDKNYFCNNHLNPYTTNDNRINDNIIINGTSVMSMGNYFFMTPEGDEIKVEFSFGYIVDNTGNLRIHLHHSSMPAII